MAENKPRGSASSDADISLKLGLDAGGSRRGRFLKWGAIMVALVAVIVVWRGLGQDKTERPRFRTAEVTLGDLTVEVTATGTLEPVNQVEVGTEVSGTIHRVLVDFNDRVKQGEVLAELNTDQFQARVKQASAALELARAQVAQSEATLVETRNALKRASELGAKNLNSPQDRDAAQAAYDRAVADLARSRAQVVQAAASLDAEKVTLSKATIHSPIQGIVLSRNVEPGQTVAASFQTPVMFTLAENLAQMELHVDVDEADVGQVREGQDATFTVAAYPDRHFPARITEVHFASQTVAGVVTYETVLSVDNSDLLLRPGMTATADIVVQKLENVTLVPNAALRFSPPMPAATPQAGNRSLLGQLFPRPFRPNKRPGEGGTGSKGEQRVWTLKAGEPVAIPLTVGASNGTVTQVVSGDIEPGTELLIDTVGTSM